MAQQNINIGTANAKDGDTLLTATTKTQANFTELYNADAALDTRLKVIEGEDPAAESGMMFVSDGAGGGEFIRIQGWGQFQDTDTSAGSPSQNIATGVRTKWTNDGGTLTLQKNPSDLINPLWNTTTNKIVPIAENDTYNIRVTFKVENYGGTSPYLDVELDIGGSIGVIVQKSITLLKSGAEQSILMSFPVFSGSTFLANGGEIYVTYNGTGTCDIFASSILIVRESKNYV